MVSNRLTNFFSKNVLSDCIKNVETNFFWVQCVKNKSNSLVDTFGPPETAWFWFWGGGWSDPPPTLDYLLLCALGVPNQPCPACKQAFQHDTIQLRLHTASGWVVRRVLTRRVTTTEWPTEMSEPVNTILIFWSEGHKETHKERIARLRNSMDRSSSKQAHTVCLYWGPMRFGDEGLISSKFDQARFYPSGWQ